MSEFNMSVQAFAGEIVAAIVTDESGEGCDISAGMFGTAFSSLIRVVVRERMDLIAEVERLTNLNNSLRYDLRRLENDNG